MSTTTGKIPRIYIQCLQDKTLVPSVTREMYTCLPCRHVISMSTGHSPFFSAPEELASQLSSLQRYYDLISFPMRVLYCLTNIQLYIIQAYHYSLYEPEYFPEGPVVKHRVGFFISFHSHGQCFKPFGIHTSELLVK